MGIVPARNRCVRLGGGPASGSILRPDKKPAVLAYYECHGHVPGITENAYVVFHFDAPYRREALSQKASISFVPRICPFASVTFFLLCPVSPFFVPCSVVKILIKLRTDIAITLRRRRGSCLSCIRPNRSTSYVTSNIS